MRIELSYGADVIKSFDTYHIEYEARPFDEIRDVMES